ncbi:hypothetical protein [Streptomyces sp. NPDC047108]|uniref:hypothetical protein n=1 Tax=Streptomyces sp. NPDC047108 TaxID=3155025 RepID=UPI0033CBCB2A
MYIPARALDGGRRHRLAVGTMLFLLMLFAGTVMTAVAVSGFDGPLAKAGIGAAAVSAYLLAWWSARYWYAAWTTGRRPEPAPEPGYWPWVLPPLVISTAAAVSGVRALARGDSSGWFTIGLATVFGLMGVAGSVLTAWTALTDRRSAAPAPAPEPPRPRRDWGSIG